MTEPGLAGTLDVSGFYDRLAPAYDEMTGFPRRFVRERPFFRLLVEGHGIARALDAGCGTGFHALLLSQLGVRVTALDVAEEMITRAAGHAREMGLTISFVRADLGNAPGVVEGPLDAVFCMGNTLPHLQNEDELQRVLVGFRSLLRPGGILFAQILNYEKILAEKTRLQSVRESGGSAFVRFYDFHAPEGRILFKILKLDRSDQGISSELITVPLLPVTAPRMRELLASAGFGEVRAFGSIAMEPYEAASSGDLVILAFHP